MIDIFRWLRRWVSVVATSFPAYGQRRDAAPVTVRGRAAAVELRGRATVVGNRNRAVASVED